MALVGGGWLQYNRETSKAAASVLNDGLLLSLGEPKEERHPHQQRIVELIGESLADMEDSIVHRLGEARRRVRDVEAETLSLNESLAATEGAVVIMKQVVETEKVVLSERVVAHRVAKAELAKAETERDEKNAALAKTKGLLQQLKTFQVDVLLPLNSKSIKREAVDDFVTQLMALEQWLNFDPALIEVTSAVFKKEPCDRIKNDLFAIANLTDVLDTRRKVYDAVVGAHESDLQPRLLKRLEVLRENCVAAKVHVESCSADLAGAQIKLDKAEAGLEAATEAANRSRLAGERAAAQICIDECALARFRNGPLKAFQDLAVRQSGPTDPFLNA